MSITLGELLTMLSIIVTLTGIVGTALWNLWRKIIKNTEDLAAFKLKVSEEYIKKSDMRQVFREEGQDG